MSRRSETPPRFVLLCKAPALNCLSGVEYRDHLRETDRNGSGRSLAAILPTLIEIDDPLMVGDRRPACELRSIEIADPPVMMVDEEPDCEDRLTEDSPTRRSPVAKPLSLFNVRERDLRIVILIILFLIGLLVLSFVFSFIQWKKNNQERDRTDQCQNKLRDLQVTREPEIPRLSEDLLVKSDEPKPVIKHGKKFGVNLGYSFDDSKAPDFNIGHYFSGLTIRSDTDDLETYEFHYTSDLSSDPIRSIFHGEDMVPMRSIFDFRHRDRITEVQGLLTRKMVQLANGTNSLIVAVTGLRFHSMNGIWSLGFQGPEQGQRFSENFTGYSLGYIKGQADRYLHQIQFVWYRTE